MRFIITMLVLFIAVPALACGGMPVVAPEPMPPAAGDSWSFLPAYQPGESLYDNADQTLDNGSSSEVQGTAAVDGCTGTVGVFVGSESELGLGTAQEIKTMDVTGATQLQDNDVQFSNDAHYNGFDAVVL
jgi:hypothetical protein